MAVLYIDFDGVIYNTINEAFKMMDEYGYDRSSHEKVRDFFINVDFNILLENGGIINDAINKIKEIRESGLYKEVVILTKLSGNYYEEGIKRHVIEKFLPGIRVITLSYDLKKDLVVNAKNNALVDDERRNIISWNQAGGIGVFFQQGVTDLSHDIIGDLSDINDTKGMKKLLKTGNL